MNKILTLALFLFSLPFNSFAGDYSKKDMMVNAWMIVLQGNGKSLTEAIKVADNLASIVSGKATRAGMRNQDCSKASDKIGNELKPNAYNLGASPGDAVAMAKYSSDYALEVCVNYKNSQ